MKPPSTFPETPDIETSSDNYAQRFAGAIGAWFLRVQEDATLHMLRDFPNAQLLDVGGGHGQLTPALVQRGYGVTVLGSHVCCRNRIQSLIDQNLCTFEVGNILDLPYPDRAFDIVISYRLLPHVVQWKQCISELTRVAQYVVLIDYPSTRSVNYIAPLLFQLKKRLEGNTRSFLSFRESELLWTFQACGFKRIDRFPEFFFPMVVHRVLKSPKLSSTIEHICQIVGLTSILGSPIILKLIREL